MADNEQIEAPIQEEPRDRQFPKLVVIVLLAIVLVGGGFFGFKIMGARERGLAKVGDVLELEEFLVNLRGEQTFLRADIALGLREGVKRLDVRKRLPAIRDTIVMTLTSKRPKEIEAPDGKQLLKAEIAARLNRLLDPESNSRQPEESWPRADNNADSPENKSNSGRSSRAGHSRPGPILEVYFTSFVTQRY